MRVAGKATAGRIDGGNSMDVGVPRETVPYEKRVALVPDGVAKLVAAGLRVIVEAGAGLAAAVTDEMYRAAGGTVVDTANDVLTKADVVLKVQPPSPEEARTIKEHGIVISFLQPARNQDILEVLSARRATALSMHRVPRITRAQSMDALSSQSSIAGYKAALVAASTLGKLMPMMMTAAGTIRPSSVFILGAGVAGLQAIATAKRLGAVVSAFDIRPAVKEQVESLGAKFIEVQIEQKETETAGGYAKELAEESARKVRELLRETLRGIDAAITTALIPDRPAPKLITEDMVKNMRPGSVIVDMAAEAGGNCELTEVGQSVVRHGVTIIGPFDLATTVPVNASQMYSRNISSLLLSQVKDGRVQLDFEDEIITAMVVTHLGEIRAGQGV
jgi:NAD(P) transhydrogenase subunit alpha